MAPKTAAPRTEKGYVNPAGGSLAGWGTNVDQFETVEALTWPNSVWTYSRMVREEARISSVLRAIGLPIRRTKWRIRPNGARDEAVALVARSLGLPIEGTDDDEPTGRTKGRLLWRPPFRFGGAGAGSRRRAGASPFARGHPEFFFLRCNHRNPLRNPPLSV